MTDHSTLWIDLTEDQQRQLSLLFDELLSGEAAGLLGAVAAQVYLHEMKVVLLRQPQARALNDALAATRKAEAVAEAEAEDTATALEA